ncbi:hypothetical protein sscle_07g056260 [Sclerotinia sclerotiorum 1980 UF-70]|uniref:Adenosine deaminase domain-containing protein n=1 Tax=Sclerotinia sclerotiorum (strain ATCC 18683 / 1980 / Ss-1) TaxID=665079 RepID=A0A1D9Q7I6_SCLS1|nr:hypothetical protein sscle_07g056260 [Sclerotinia sclerotiorum 1980 UF-70]
MDSSSSEEIIDFTSLPKIELHAHLSGSISRQCLHEVWLQKQERGETTLVDPLVEMPDGKFDYDLETFFPLFSKYIYELCNDLSSLIYTTNSVLSDFQADGVVYLELRTTPRAIPSAGITKDIYIQTILDCINKHNNANPSMKTRLILSIDRRNDAETAMQVVKLAHKYHSQDLGVVGIDLCGDPSVGDISIFEAAFRAARNHDMKITIHFAEMKQVSRKELETLLEFKPHRIGHVIHVPEDLKREIERSGLGLELCLSCNVHAKMITGSFGDHHFGEWWGSSREGNCSVVLCTDDVGVFGSKLSDEYALVARHFNLDRKDICTLARSGIEVIFGSEGDREWLRGVMWRV